MATTTYSWLGVTTSDFLNDSFTAGNQNSPAIASSPGGGRYFGVWTFPGASDSIEGRIVNSNGVPVGGEFLVNSTTLNDQFDASVTGLANSDWVVSYTDFSADPGGDIRFRRFDFNGTALGNDVVIDASTLDDAHSDVTTLADG